MADSSTPGPRGSGVSLSIPILLALIAGGMAATTNAQVFALLLAPKAEGFGISVARLGGMRSIEEVVAILTAVLLTPFIDRTARKKLLLFGYVLMGCASTVAFSAQSHWHLIGFFTLDGIAKILLFSTLLALPADLASGHRLDRVLGFVIGSFALSGFTIVPLVGYVAGQFSWREGYLVTIGVAVTTFVIVALLIPTTSTPHTQHESPFRHIVLLIKLPGLLAALLSAFMRFTMFGGVLTFTGAFLIDHHNVSVGRAGLYFSFGAAAFLGCSVLSGFLLRHIGIRNVLIPGGLLTGSLIFIGFASGMALLFVGAALIAAAAMMGILENASTGLLFRLSRGHRGAAMSLNELGAAAGSLLGIGLGALSIGLIGYAGIGIALGLIAMIAAALTSIAFRALNTYSESALATSEGSSGAS